jgi:hypothetical protein
MRSGSARHSHTIFTLLLMLLGGSCLLRMLPPIPHARS